MHQLQLAQIVLFVLAGFALPALGMILLSWLLQLFLGYHTPTTLKTQSYECGMKPFKEANVQFDIRYYLYALLFILFDIEIVFIIPWALATDALDVGLKRYLVGPIEILIFLTILAVGLAYAWKKGALQWE